MINQEVKIYIENIDTSSPPFLGSAIDTCNKIKGRRKGTYFTINVLLLSLLLILFY
tara:strand:+ start:208 stop:375 length:168 start_codon:yes stop_codon:yes gene_type:complete